LRCCWISCTNIVHLILNKNINTIHLKSWNWQFLHLHILIHQIFQFVAISSIPVCFNFRCTKRFPTKKKEKKKMHNRPQTHICLIIMNGQVDIWTCLRSCFCWKFINKGQNQPIISLKSYFKNLLFNIFIIVFILFKVENLQVEHETSFNFQLNHFTTLSTLEK
jgi:hypothetical protein